MSDVQFDFQKANSQIDQLEDITAQLEKLASGQYEQTLRQIKNSWSGAGADEFIRKASKVRSDIEQAGSTAKKTVEAYKQAVQKAKTAEAKSEGIVTK